MSQEDKNKDGKPTPPSEENQDENMDTPVEADLDSQEDTDFEKELEALEAGEDEQPLVEKKPVRTELEKAEFTAKSTLKRIKELGGDPSKLMGDVEKPAEKPHLDTTQFVTKLDLAQQEAERIAKSPGEAKLIMWYVRNKGMSVSDAHFLANKSKITKIVSETSRAREVIPAPANGGAGQRAADTVDAPELPELERQRLIQSGMVYNAEKKAYIGKKIQHRFDPKAKAWVTERL